MTSQQPAAFPPPIGPAPKPFNGSNREESRQRLIEGIAMHDDRALHGLARLFTAKAKRTGWASHIEKRDMYLAEIRRREDEQRGQAA
jgi:hypothetical protein